MPIVQEGIATITPSIGKVAETIAKRIARGIAEGKTMPKINKILII